MFKKQKDGIITSKGYAWRSDLDWLEKEIEEIAKELNIKFDIFCFGGGPAIDKTQKNKIDVLTERIEKIEEDLIMKEIEESGFKTQLHFAIKKIKDIFKQKLNIDSDNLEYQFEEKLVEKEIKESSKDSTREEIK